MARLNLSDLNNEEVKVNNEVHTLDELIPMYAENKAELDQYKKTCDVQNATIKDTLKEMGIDEYSAGGYTVKRTVVERESMNEDRLIDILKKHKVSDVIKTKEYVDMDALEKYLYNTEISDDMAGDLDSCREVKQTIQLRLSKAKAKKKENDNE